MSYLMCSIVMIGKCIKFLCFMLDTPFEQKHPRAYLGCFRLKGNLEGNVEKRIIIVGAGGHASSLLDCIDKKEVFGFVDEFKQGSYEGIRIVANSVYDVEDKDMYRYHIAIGNVEVRERLKHIIDKLGLELVNVIANDANVSKDAVIGVGNFIGKKVVIDAGVVIGDNNILNTGAVIEHGSKIGNNCNISTVAVINGDVEIGDGVFVGSNAVCNGQLSVGDGATVGSGAVVTRSVEAGATVVGVPAREVAV